MMMTALLLDHGCIPRLPNGKHTCQPHSRLHTKHTRSTKQVQNWTHVCRMMSTPHPLHCTHPHPYPPTHPPTRPPTHARPCQMVSTPLSNLPGKNGKADFITFCSSRQSMGFRSRGNRLLAQNCRLVFGLLAFSIMCPTVR